VNISIYFLIDFSCLLASKMVVYEVTIAPPFYQSSHLTVCTPLVIWCRVIGPF